MADQSQGPQSTATSPQKHISEILQQKTSSAVSSVESPTRTSKPAPVTSWGAAAASSIPMAQMPPSDEDDFASYGDDGDASNDSYWFTSSDEDDEDGELGPEELAYRANRMVMFALYTHYDVIKEVAKFTFDYHLTKRENCQWDIAWYDGPITIRLLQRMQQYQRTNHFPGIYNLAKKNMLGRHLMRLQSVFPDDYNFFPPTFNLPADFKEFLYQVGNKRNKTFIVKPEASCQGKGIFLTRDPESLTTEKTMHTNSSGVVEHMVVQRYMHKPYLIDGYKFDLRLYVLMNGISPLRVYVYKDGLARFATVKYQKPAPSNLGNLCMHLTNYAINKESDNFVQNDDQDADDVGSKRSYQFVLKKIKNDYGLLTMRRVQEEINEIIVKTLCLAQPHVHHLYRSCQPDDIENSMCFQILGFDIMIDHKLKPSLIEVNQMPSFQTDSPLDYKIKQGVIHDCINLLNLSVKRRNRIKNQKKIELQRRLLKGYSHKIPVDLMSTTTTVQPQKPATTQKAANSSQKQAAAASAEKPAPTAQTAEKASQSKDGGSTTAGAASEKGNPSALATSATGAAETNTGEKQTKPAPTATTATHDKAQTTAQNAIQANANSHTSNNNNTQSTNALLKTGSKANLLNSALGSQQKNSGANHQAVSKANLRNLAMQSKQELIIKKRLLREKNESALCGGYELIYPFITYEEEENIKAKVTQLQKQGVQGKSVKNLIGLNAPQTLKEKLASLHSATNANTGQSSYGGDYSSHQPGMRAAPGEGTGSAQLTRTINNKTSSSSKQVTQTNATEGGDGATNKAPPQLGENTIEMAAVEQLMKEANEFAINDDEIQQGTKDDNGQGSLAERWLKQVKYENFMECARKMWDQFTSGSQINKQRRLRAKAEETLKQQADQERKEKAKRDAARKNLSIKLRKQAEERRQKQEERLKMMEQIEEEKEKQKEKKLEASENIFNDKRQSMEKLDMAELKEQHRKLTNKIAESQKKVLEEGLRRNRKSSQFEKREVRRSINTLELVTGSEQTELRKSQQKLQSTTASKPYRLQSNGPNMDYFKHIQQKVQDKQEQRKNSMINVQKTTSLISNQGIRLTSAENENRGLKPEAQLKPATSHSDLPKYDHPPITANTQIGQQNETERIGTNTEEKPKTSGFPLDHILPVFNLNKKDVSFIPILKPKSKIEQPAYQKEKKPGGLVKGSTIQHSQQVSQQSIENGATWSPTQKINHNLSGAASQATLIQNSNHSQFVQYKQQANQAGYSSREQRRGAGALNGQTSPDLVATGKYNAALQSKVMQAMNQSGVHQPVANCEIIPLIDSFRPKLEFAENSLKLISKIGGKRASYQTTKQSRDQKAMDIVEQFINREYQKQNFQQQQQQHQQFQQSHFSSLEPSLSGSNMVFKAGPGSPKSSLMPDLSKSRERPNVTKINLDVDPRANHSIQHQKYNFTKNINHTALTNSFIKPPQIDIIQKLSRKDQNNLISTNSATSGSNTLPQHRSSKFVPSLANNSHITVQRLPQHQRQQPTSSKLGDLLADVSPKVQKHANVASGASQPQVAQPAIYFKLQNAHELTQSNYVSNATTQDKPLGQAPNTGSATSNGGVILSKSGLKIMQNVSSNQQPLGSPPAAPVNSSLEVQLEGLLPPARHAMLPELSNQHISKELKNYTLNGRSVSNTSQLGGQNQTSQSEFVTSYQTNSTATNANNYGQAGHLAKGILQKSPVKTNQYVAQNRRDSHHTQKHNVRRHEAYNLVLNDANGSSSAVPQQMSVSGMVLHSEQLPVQDQNFSSAASNYQKQQQKQFARVKERVAIKSYQAADLDGINDLQSSPIINSSFKRNLSVFGGGTGEQMLKHPDSATGVELHRNKNSQQIKYIQLSASPSKNKKLFTNAQNAAQVNSNLEQQAAGVKAQNLTVMNVVPPPHTSKAATSSAAKQQQHSASARSNIDMLSGVSLRQQKEMLEKAGIISASTLNL